VCRRSWKRKPATSSPAAFARLRSAPDERGHQPDLADRLRRLRLNSVAVPIDLLAHPHEPAVEVNVRPRQPEQLATSCTPPFASWR
jgi:hypothetical protein